MLSKLLLKTVAMLKTIPPNNSQVLQQRRAAGYCRAKGGGKSILSLPELGSGSASWEDAQGWIKE